MADYKLTVGTNLSEAASLIIADKILNDHGPEFDADLGDFSVEVLDKAVIVTVLDVADGDIQNLAEAILNETTFNVVIRVSKFDGHGWFPHELEEDE